MRLTCNGKERFVSDTMTICYGSIICSTVGNGDLGDLGFTVDDLNNHDLIVQNGELKITFESKLTQQKRMVTQLAAEHKVSDTAAKFFLLKHDWNYGQASLYIRLAKTSQPNSKPCGEILLAEIGTCVLVDAAFRPPEDSSDRLRNPRMEIETVTLCMECVCGTVGKAHCRVHHTNELGEQQS